MRRTFVLQCTNMSSSGNACQPVISFVNGMQPNIEYDVHVSFSAPIRRVSASSLIRRPDDWIAHDLIARIVVPSESEGAIRLLHKGSTRNADHHQGETSNLLGLLVRKIFTHQNTSEERFRTLSFGLSDSPAAAFVSAFIGEFRPVLENSG